MNETVLLAAILGVAAVAVLGLYLHRRLRRTGQQRRLARRFTAMHVDDRLADAVAGGARYASRVDFDDPDHTFVGRVKNMTVYGNPDGTGRPLAPGLTTDIVRVTWTTDAKGVPQTITVGITSSNKQSVTVQYTGSFKQRFPF